MFIKIFNRQNFTKLVIIFTLGLIYRGLVNSYFDVNVFTDFTNFISLLYYFAFSTSIALVHEIVDFFHLSIFPNFLFQTNVVGVQHYVEHVNTRTDIQGRITRRSHRGNLSYKNNPDISYKKQSKRALHWFLWERYNDKSNYRDFKQSWDPNTKIFSEIKKGVTTEVKKKLHSATLFNKTMKWFLNRRKGD